LTRQISVGSVAEVHGTCDKRFGTLGTTLAELLDDTDVGASAAVFVDGEPVADLWGGYQDTQRINPCSPNTITNVRPTPGHWRRAAP
jgi:hypothetical protein